MPAQFFGQIAPAASPLALLQAGQATRRLDLERAAQAQRALQARREQELRREQLERAAREAERDRRMRMLALMAQMRQQEYQRQSAQQAQQALNWYRQQQLRQQAQEQKAQGEYRRRLLDLQKAQEERLRRAALARAAEAERKAEKEWAENLKTNLLMLPKDQVQDIFEAPDDTGWRMLRALYPGLDVARARGVFWKEWQAHAPTRKEAALKAAPKKSYRVRVMGDELIYYDPSSPDAPVRRVPLLSPEQRRRRATQAKLIARRKELERLAEDVKGRLERDLNRVDAYFRQAMRQTEDKEQAQEASHRWRQARENYQREANRKLAPIYAEMRDIERQLLELGANAP